MISGGLFYHFKSMISGESWNQARQVLDDTFKPFLEKHSELILFGPSAGYLLPSLKNHHGIRLDIDPLSKPLFALRHGNGFVSESMDLFPNGKINESSIAELLQSRPQAGLIFCNILGQMPLQYGRNFDSNNWQKLNQLVLNRSLISFHDRLSGPKPAGSLTKIIDYKIKPSIEQVVSDFSLVGEWVDHETSTLFQQGVQYRYFLWPLSPRRAHLIEICF